MQGQAQAQVLERTWSGLSVASGDLPRVEPAAQDECFETTMGDLDALIRTLSTSLEVCDRRSAPYQGLTVLIDPDAPGADAADAHRSTATATTTTGSRTAAVAVALPLPPITTTPDLLTAPVEWWSAGVRHARDWLRCVFLERLAARMRQALDDARVPPACFQWRVFTDRVTLDAASGSLAHLLQACTDTDPAGGDSAARPRGWHGRRQSTLQERASLASTLERLCDDFAAEAARTTAAQQAALAEVLAGCARACRALLEVHERERAQQVEYRRAARHRDWVALQAVQILQRWLLEHALEHAEARTRQYNRYREQLAAEFRAPLERVRQQRERFRSVWMEARRRYEAFLRAQGLAQQDEAVVEAVDVLTAASGGDGDDAADLFGRDAVRTLRRYIAHMRRLAHAVQVAGTGGALSSSKAAPLSHPVRQLYDTYQQKRQRLEQLQAEVAAAKQALDALPPPPVPPPSPPAQATADGVPTVPTTGSGGDTATAAAAVVDDAWVAAKARLVRCERERDAVQKQVESGARLLQQYMDDPDDEHNRWMRALDRLDQTVEQVAQDWARTHKSKWGREAVVDEEMTRSMRQLERALYDRYQHDLEQLAERHRCAQAALERAHDDNLRQSTCERRVAHDWLATFERKLVYYDSAGPVNRHLRRVEEFRSVLRLWVAAGDTLARLDDAGEAYADMLQVWRMLYGLRAEYDQCVASVATVTPTTTTATATATTTSTTATLCASHMSIV